MMSVQLSCPYCNTAVTLESLPAARRTACGRCGESFPIRLTEDQGLAEVPAGEPPLQAAFESAPARPRRCSLLAMLGLGLAAAAVLLAIGLYLVRDRSLPFEGPPPPSAATVPPASVAGLALLPDETSIAIAVQPRPLLAYAERTGSDPRTLLVKAGLPARLFATLDRLGLTLDQVDHIAAGVVLGSDSLLPRVIFVLSLTQPPADEGAFLRELRATQYTTPEGATRYKGIDLGIPLPIELARLDAKTYAFASNPRDLEGLESSRGRGSSHLPAGLRESLARLSPAAVAWAASDVAVWEDRAIVKLLAEGGRNPRMRERLQGIRAVAAGLSLEPDPVLTAAVRGADTTTVRRLEKLAADSTVRVDDLWVTVQGPGSAEWLRNLLPPAPK